MTTLSEAEELLLLLLLQAVGLGVACWNYGEIVFIALNVWARPR